MSLLTLAVFFASGFAALLYQVTWQRMLAIFSGADVYSATIIVAAYMAGLGLGSLLAGQLAVRLSARTSLVLFAVAELAIAGFAAFSTTLYYDILYQRYGHIDIAPAAMAALLFASLLWPTFFMGASLPLLARAMTRNLEGAASTVGTLYGVNTLGAAAGALVSTWVLLPAVGLDGSITVGAWTNLSCALALIPLALASRREAGDAAPATGPTLGGSETVGTASGFWWWAAIYGVSGMLALSLEIVWFRLLGVMMKSTAFTFGTLLAIYLTGVGLGSLIGSFKAPRLQRPALVFLGMQAAVGIVATGALITFLALAGRMGPLSRYFEGYEPLNVPSAVGTAPFFLLYFIIPAVLVIPATLLMGASFPVLQRVVQTDLGRVGSRVGILLLANVMGSMLGAMATGWLLLDWLGTSGTLTLLAAVAGVFAVTALRMVPRTQAPAYTRSLAALAAAAVLAVVLMPGTDRLWAAVHGTTPAGMVVREDGSGLSVLKTRQPGYEGRVVVYVNGMGQSLLPYGDIHTALGAVPALLHPGPRDAAVIGLGSGDTVYAVAGRPDLERITCIEIVRPQLDTLRELAGTYPYGGLRSLLGDRRIEHLFGDGRIHLMRTSRRYDIIEADALRPGSAYSGNLYSEEYFDLVRSRLTPNGLAATWAPTARNHNAFLRVFPHVISLPGMMVGSNEPIVVDRAALAARLADPRVIQHYESAEIDIRGLMNTYLEQPTTFGPDFDRGTLTDYNTDLFPKDEYNLTR